MPNVDQLHTVKPGDRPSASQHNIIVEAVKAKQAGVNAFESERGYAQRPSAMKFSRVAQFRVEEDPPAGDPTPARQYLTCVEIDNGMVVSEPTVVSLTPQTAIASHLYTMGMLLFAAEVIDDMGVTDDDGKPVRWLEIIPPALTGDPADLTWASGSTTALTSTWDRADQTANGMATKYQRIEWESSTFSFVAFEWTETVDASGKKVSKSAETKRTLVATSIECPEPA